MRLTGAVGEGRVVPGPESDSREANDSDGNRLRNTELRIHRCGLWTERDR